MDVIDRDGMEEEVDLKEDRWLVRNDERFRVIKGSFFKKTTKPLSSQCYKASVKTSKAKNSTQG